MVQDRPDWKEIWRFIHLGAGGHQYVDLFIVGTNNSYDVIEVAQMSYTTKIPDGLASGQYLIRHEIIALHLAVTQGGAEFYPSCTQVKVGGSQASTASSNELVSFPGAYADSDPGIYDPDVSQPGIHVS